MTRRAPLTLLWTVAGLLVVCAAGCRPYPTYCGNDACEAGETPTSCPADCGAAVCGDGVCSRPRGETCTTCAMDCGACPVCGDGTCNTGESCVSCVEDCGACLTCGNGTCESDENCAICEVDCGSCPVVCGDRVCTPGAETCTSCPTDCGSCITCGDGFCDSAAGENCGTCSRDCGACPASCGDLICNGTETCATCASDCGSCITCGDGWCSSGESCVNCAFDCGACGGCGDGYCATASGESCSTCPTDCGSCGVCGNGLCDGFESCETCSRDCGSCGWTGAAPYETCIGTSDCRETWDTCVYVANGSLTRGMCTVTMCASDSDCDYDMFGARGDCLSFGGGQWNCYHRCADDGDCYPGWGCFTPVGASGAAGPVCMPAGSSMTVAHYRECAASAECIDALQCVSFRVGTASTNLCSRTGCGSDMDCPLDLRGGRGACLSFGGSYPACWERCQVRGDCPNTVDYDCTTNVGGYVSPVPICVPR